MPAEVLHNEKHLLQQMADGNASAFREIFNFYRSKLYTNIFKLTDSREIAEDTVHEVFLKIWANRQMLPGINNFSAYISRMAHNHAYTGFRRMAKETLILAELRKESEPGQDHPERQLLAKEVRDFIYRAIQNLTPQQKQVFLMSREEGLKHEQIAEKLHISVFTVKKHMADALRFLREEIGNSYHLYAVALFVMYDLGFS